MIPLWEWISCNIADDTREDVLMSLFLTVRQKEFLPPCRRQRLVKADLPSVWAGRKHLVSQEAFILHLLNHKGFISTLKSHMSHLCLRRQTQTAEESSEKGSGWRRIHVWLCVNTEEYWSLAQLHFLTSTIFSEARLRLIKFIYLTSSTRASKSAHRAHTRLTLSQQPINETIIGGREDKWTGQRGA